MRPKCKLCSAIVYGRSDSKFCSSRCRVASHRQQLRLPHELINRDRWIRYSKNKVPLQVNGSTASSIDLDTWSDFITANASDAGVGLGFVFNDDGIVGIDLDNALYKNGQIKSWAKQIVDKFSGTYMEISPSKLGLHIYLIGEIDKASRQKIEDGGLEIYSTSRYFTVTGNNYKSSPLTLIDFGKIEVSDVRSSA